MGKDLKNKNKKKRSHCENKKKAKKSGGGVGGNERTLFNIAFSSRFKSAQGRFTVGKISVRNEQKFHSVMRERKILRHENRCRETCSHLSSTANIKYITLQWAAIKRRRLCLGPLTFFEARGWPICWPPAHLVAVSFIFS